MDGDWKDFGEQYTPHEPLRVSLELPNQDPRKRWQNREIIFNRYPQRSIDVFREEVTKAFGHNPETHLVLLHGEVSFPTTMELPELVIAVLFISKA